MFCFIGGKIEKYTLGISRGAQDTLGLHFVDQDNDGILLKQCASYIYMIGLIYGITLGCILLRVITLVPCFHFVNMIVLGYQTQDSKCDTPSSKSQMTFLEQFPAHSLPLFLYTLNFLLQIQNHHFDPNIFQDNLIPLILTCNSNYSLSCITYSLTKVALTLPIKLRQLNWL